MGFFDFFKKKTDNKSEAKENMDSLTKSANPSEYDTPNPNVTLNADTPKPIFYTI